MSSDECRQIVDDADEGVTRLSAFLGPGRDVPHDTVIASGCRNRLSESLRARRGANQDRATRSPLCRPHIAQKPFGELPNKEEGEPKERGGKDHRQNQLG